jgi:hypothetical protein
MSSVAAVGGGMPQVWSGASMRMPPAQKMATLFDKIDAAGSGSITKAQFEQAFQSMSPPKGFQQLGADAIWAKLDPNGSGSVSKQDFVGNMTGIMSQIRQGHHHRGTDTQNAPAPTSTISASLDSLSSLTTGGTISTTA